MGRLYEYNDEVEDERQEADVYTIRIPLRMTQLTEKDGRAWPLAFDWQGADGSMISVRVGRVVSVTPCAELKSGAVGDRYECEIGGLREHLFYSRLQPRKWFKLQEVSEEAYNAYYRLPDERGEVLSADGTT